MVKGPSLVCLDFHAGMARRYLRQKHMVVAGLGWQLVKTHQASFDINDSLPPAAVEMFRTTGHV